MATATKRTGAGALTERITIQTPTPSAVSVTSITRSGATATVTTAAVHGFTTGDYVTHAGAVQTDYNVEAQVTVTNTTVYTFTVANAPTTPATGTITVTYTSDSQGGTAVTWSTLATVWAAVRPLSAGEQLAIGGISATVQYRATVYYRADVTPKMRVSWTKYLESTARTLEIQGVQDAAGDQRRMLVLDLGEVA